MLGIFGVTTSLIIQNKEGKIKTAQDELDELLESDQPLEEKIKQTEKTINENKTLITRIERTGRIGYPVILGLIVLAIWILYKQG